jgi:cytochrome c
MDSFELNKIAGGVILALLIGMVASYVGRAIVHPNTLEKNVYEIAVADAATTGQPGDAKKELEPVDGLLATAMIENGQKIVQKVCTQCHTLDQGGANKIGPNLWNIVGAGIAQKEGFSYSAAFKAKTGNWSYDHINKLIAKPRDFVPGTKMSFVGLSKVQDRADVIAYLRTLAATPKPLP